MTERDFKGKLDELDRLLNDPDAPLEPARVWALLGEVASRDAVALAPSASRSDKMRARA